MLWFSTRKSSSAAHLSRASRNFAQPSEMFERLEERIVFYAGPMLTGLPQFGVLENQNNTVVRMHTNVGNIDIELFDQTAPGTVNNFKRYIDNGLLDETFFHRLVPGFVLQGGGFTFHNDVGAEAVETFDPIPNEFSRLNLEGTIAMAKIGGQPDSATSQFFFNLTDNPNLDEQNGGFTVFGRVIQGWDVVQSIAGLQVRNLNAQLTGSAFGEVPTRGNYDPNVGPTEASLVRINDIEVIKRWGSNRYFRHVAHISEGFSGANVVERIDLQNFHRENQVNHYQIIVRYENGIRDQVISTGVLQPGERRTFKVSDANFPDYQIVRPNEPYAIEVRSTVALAASLNHRDAGGTVEEAFINTLGYRRAELMHWRIPGGEKAEGVQSFLHYQNLSSEPVTMYILIRSEDGTARYLQRTVEPFRRGGVELHNIGVIPNGKFSVQINALGPIVAGLSQYRAGTAATGNAGMTTGVLAGGSTHGVLPAARIPANGEAFVDLMYTQQTPNLVIVNMQYIRSNNFSESAQVILTAAQRAQRINLSEMFPSLPTNEFFTLRYSVQGDSSPVAAQYTIRAAGDEATTRFQTNATQTVAFASGFTDPAMATANQMIETISVFNPYNADAGALYFYDLVFQFSDGTVIFAASNLPFSLNAHQRRDHSAWAIPAVRAKIESAPEFRFYSVQVVAAPFPVGPVVAQMTRTIQAWNHTSTSSPAVDPRLPVHMLDQEQFR